MGPRLSEDQLHAATSPARRLFIEAGPGAGKTTVTAERFGLARYTRQRSPSAGVVGLSFTIAATSELRRRIATRWGPRALGHPSRVLTIDAELVDVLCRLLRQGLIAWPGDHVQLDPLDSLGRHPALKWNPQGYNTFVTTLVGREVAAVAAPGGRYRITKGDLLGLLTQGLCTHDDVRNVLRGAMADPDVRTAIVAHCHRTVAHLLVDEVFDADDVDLELIRLHCEADVPVTVVGDRWQALYEWRDAQPNVVAGALLDEMGFEHREILQSHRYRTDDARQLAADVRGEPVVVPDAGADVDIAIAARWRDLWRGPPWVLPMSFGRVDDQTDAILALLLDHVLRREFDLGARSRADGLLTLRLDPTTPVTWPSVFGPVEALLVDTSEATAGAALAALRAAGPDLGTERKVAPRRNWGEKMAATQLRWLAARLVRGGPFTLGITAHQAKGRQWERVGVCLTDEAVAALGAGLDVQEDDHRTLYVALTRGVDATGRITGGPIDE